MTDEEINKILDYAQTHYAAAGGIEIDNGAEISKAETGAWVQAWVWVPSSVYEEATEGEPE